MTTPAQFQLTTTSELHTLRLGRALARSLQPGDVLTLVGPLGAGKTQFVRGVATGLDVDERHISSPTFVLINEYPGRLPVVHIDAYRLSDPDELETIGFSPELLENAVTLIEWADRVGSALPADHLLIEIEHATETQRHLHFTPHGSWQQRLPTLRKSLESALRSAACPTCKTAVPEDTPTFPFCSPRCRMADLNKWFEGEYRISRPLDEEDLDDI